MLYAAFGLLLTSIVCIPILFILIFGFYRIYSRYENEQKKWKSLKNLSIACIIIPLTIALLIGITDFSSLGEFFTWFFVMLTYASSGVFFILYISNKADLRNPPQVIKNQNVSELEGILDSGFKDDF